MITGTASVLAGAIGSIRRIAGAAQAALGEFRGAGGGLRGVAAGARAAAGKLLPEAALDARREIEGLRVATAGKLNAMIGDLRREIASLRSGGGDPSAAECQLAAAIQCRLDL